MGGQKKCQAIWEDPVRCGAPFALPPTHPPRGGWVQREMMASASVADAHRAHPIILSLRPLGSTHAPEQVV